MVSNGFFAKHEKWRTTLSVDVYVILQYMYIFKYNYFMYNVNRVFYTDL